jgi:hypothetical protein
MQGSEHITMNPPEQLGYLIRRQLGFRVPDTPHFDTPESTAWFLKRLSTARRYLEFGSGGTTYAAARLGVDFVTVDTDRHFLDAVREKIRRAKYTRPGQVFHHADIGRTGAWGRPVGKVTSARREQFRRYSDMPAECLDGPLPDLILIDGRFRIACALKALHWHMLRDDADWVVVVDDYDGRPAYRVLTDFAETHYVGRMAVLTGLKPSAPNDLVEAIEAWETVRD